MKAVLPGIQNLCLFRRFLPIFHILSLNGLSGHIIWALSSQRGDYVTKHGGSYHDCTALFSFIFFSLAVVCPKGLICCRLAFLPFSTMAADKFETFVDQARGQSVYFNAWGGSPAINAYMPGQQIS